MPLNKADTHAQLIDPKLKAAGWTDSLITRERFYRRDDRYTAGRIYLVSDEARRREPRRVDYLLRHTDAFPFALVEAKDESQPADEITERDYDSAACNPSRNEAETYHHPTEITASLWSRSDTS